MEQDMTNENPGNGKWKNKLEEISNLPDEPLGDKNATWEKLHHRLHGKPRRKRVVWYWAAAACLLMVMVMPVLKKNSKQAETMQTNPVKTLPVNSFLKNTAPLQKQNPAPGNTTAVEKSTILTAGIRLKKVVFSVRENLQKVPVVRTELNNQPAGPELWPIEQTQVQDIALTSTIALLSNTKKLKVVHINELGDPLPEIHSKNRIADYKPIQVRLINQEVYTTATPANNPGFNFLRINKNPSN
jgi:hypothetical protein